MNRPLVAVVAAAALGAFGFAAWSAFSGDDSITSERTGSFDLSSVPVTTSSVRPVELREPRAAPVSPRPIPMSEMAAEARPAAPSRAGTEAVQAAPRFLTPRLVRAVRAARSVASLLKEPARLFAASSGSPLGSPRALRAFLADKPAVERYMDSTMVRVVLNSPAAAKLVLGSPRVVGAFLSAPALRDPAVVRALVSSRMVVKMLDCPGVQEALADPAVIRGLADSPAAAEFIGKNPEALQALASAAPGLARAMAR